MLERAIERTKLKEILNEQNGVQLSGEVYEIPFHRQPVFEGQFKGGPFPAADNICDRHVCLPVYGSMTKEEAQHVVMSLRKTVASSW